MLRWSAFYIVRRKVFIHNVEVEIRELSFRHGESFRERISIPSPVWNRVDHNLFTYVPGGLWEPAEEGGWKLDSFVHGSRKGCACQGGVESLHSQRNLGLHWEVVVLPQFPLGDQSLVNLNKMVQRGKIKSWQAITKKLRRAFLKELPLIMKKVKVHHVKWQIHMFLSLNSLTSQIATLPHTWELSYPLLNVAGFKKCLWWKILGKH